MGRIFNSYYPVHIDTEANANAMADKIAEISNGKLSVYSVTSDRTIRLRYLNTDLLLSIEISGSHLRGYFGYDYNGTYHGVTNIYSQFSSYASNLRICYSEIDDTLFCLTVKDVSYIGTLSNSNILLNFTIANTIINNNNYLTCSCDSESNSPFGADSYTSGCIHFTMAGTYVGRTESGGKSIINLYNMRQNVLYSGTALLIPYYFFANTINHTLTGEVHFSGQTGKQLYALLPPTSDGMVDPRENYIINGVSYKACGDIVKLFL